MYRPEQRQKIAYFLQAHGQGRAKAIPEATLAEIAGLSDTRQVREIVNDLIESGLLIVSSSDGASGGVFMPATYEEYQEATAHLASRAMALLKRKRLTDGLAIEKFGKQASLFELEKVG